MKYRVEVEIDNLGMAHEIVKMIEKFLHEMDVKFWTLGISNTAKRELDFAQEK